jgi:hypothetical protein
MLSRALARCPRPRPAPGPGAACGCRRGMRVLRPPVDYDSWGRQVPPGPAHAAGSCSCGLCSSAYPTANHVGLPKDYKADFSGSSGTTSASESGPGSDLLTSTMARNQRLEEELAELRVHTHRHLSMRVDEEFGRMTEEDPDIAQLLDNNKKWVAEQLVSGR